MLRFSQYRHKIFNNNELNSLLIDTFLRVYIFFLKKRLLFLLIYLLVRNNNCDYLFTIVNND